MQHYHILQKPHGHYTILCYVSIQQKKWYTYLETELNFDIKSIYRDILKEERSKAHIKPESPFSSLFKPLFHSCYPKTFYTNSCFPSPLFFSPFFHPLLSI